MYVDRATRHTLSLYSYCSNSVTPFPSRFYTPKLRRTHKTDVETSYLKLPVFLMVIRGLGPIKFGFLVSLRFLL